MNCYQASQLRAFDADLSTPFEVVLRPGDSGRWVCDEVLRWLPGKRLVMALRQGGDRCLGKLFFSPRDFRRELRGHRALQAAQIDAPALLEHFRQGRSALCVIRYAFLEAPTLELLNRERAVDAQTPALHATIDAVAAMHRQGLRQVDIHPGNFLCQQDRVYVVDSAEVRAHRAPLSGRLARENLGDLLAQFPPGQLEDLDALWQRYRAQWPELTWQRAELEPAIAHMRRLRWRHYRRKLTRRCSEFGCRHSRRRFEVWRADRDTPALQGAMAAPDAAMEEGRYLKLGNTATVARVGVDVDELIIKRYNIKDWRHRLSRCWRPSRGWHSWHNAHYLLFNGMHTPTPVALIEERCGPLRGRAYFLCDFASGRDLKSALVSATAADRSRLLGDFAALLLCYRAAGISHGDMKADNFIVTPAGVTIIDLDPMRHHRRPSALNRALRRDVGRFLQNFDGADRGTIAGQLLPLLPPTLHP